MLYSRKLLERFLPKLSEINDNELSKAIGSTGNELPLNSIYKHPEVNNLVIGRILSFEKHPNSDHLNICKVQINNNGDVNVIVCGAKNVEANKNVVVALEGAKLHDGRVIEYKEVRGVVSQGMLCGYYELTPLNTKYISPQDSQGIMLFDDGEIGDTNVSSFLGLDDTIYDIEVPFANRNDINGVLSFCQDLAGYFNWDFTYPNYDFSKANLNLNADIKYNDKICTGFGLAKVENISVCESDWKNKQILMNNGFKPLNNVLDDLNYITLLTNVPTAAYQLSEDDVHFSVDTAKDGDTFTGFDDKKYILNNNDIVVKNNDKIICLAGILGDRNHGINSNSKTIYIEMAGFNFVNIRNTASKHNIQTDSAKRNSKKNNNFLILLALSLLQNTFANNNLCYRLEIHEDEVSPILFDEKKINEILGTNFSKNDITKHLQSLGFKINGDKILPPPWRNDVSTNPDLAEEIIKTIDVNSIPSESIDTSGISETKYTEYYFINRFWNILSNNFVYEVKTYNTTNKNNLNKFNVFDYQDNVEIISSNNINRQMLRNNLIGSMLNVYKYNLQYKNSIHPIFETQKIYQNGKDGIKNLTILSPEKYNLDNVNHSQIVYNINGLKGIIEQIVNLLNAKVNYKLSENENFYNNECVSIEYNNAIIGYIGCLKKTLLSEYNINDKVYCATLNWNDLYENFSESVNVFQPISNLMPIIKDVTFIYDNISFAQPCSEVRKLAFINNIEFIDRFENNGTVTYTLRFFMKNQENLTKNIIDKNLEEIISIFAANNIKIKQ
ncbi:MAG: phenylalanine--tRNA ligase subunit beta [Mycoplasmataceae bacterium]|nr:phenylalanine--tRNA ligase subunit beta [Mycoplasmataceae bacterium]